MTIKSISKAPKWLSICYYLCPDDFLHEKAPDEKYDDVCRVDISLRCLGLSILTLQSVYFLLLSGLFGSLSCTRHACHNRNCETTQGYSAFSKLSPIAQSPLRDKNLVDCPALFVKKKWFTQYKELPDYLCISCLLNWWYYLAFVYALFFFSNLCVNINGRCKTYANILPFQMWIEIIMRNPNRL